jgi:hypothetical protein
MSEASNRQFYRAPGEFCPGSYGVCAAGSDDRAVCPFCGVCRRSAKRKPWDGPTFPPHYVPRRPSPATINIPDRDLAVKVRALIGRSGR